MTDDDLRHAQVLRRLGDWEGVLRLYYRAWLPNKSQPFTGLFQGRKDWTEWCRQHPGRERMIHEEELQRYERSLKGQCLEVTNEQRQ